MSIGTNKYVRVRGGIGVISKDDEDAGGRAVIAPPPVFGYVAKFDIGVNETTNLITEVWVDVLYNPLVPFAGVMSGITYLGFGVFRNDSGSDIVKSFPISGDFIQSGGTFPPTDTHVRFCIGKFDGVTYVPDESSQTDEIRLRIAASANPPATSRFQLLIQEVSIPKGQQFRLMVKRRIGGRSFIIRAFSKAIL